MFSQKILIIDDDETIKFSFQSFLNEKNYEVDYAKNGKEGLEKLSSFKPELIIADYKMPEMTGLEFIKASKIICPSIPVIIVSAFGDKETQRLFFNEGAFDYIEKPFDIETMLDAIKKGLGANKSIHYNEISDEFIGSSPQILSIFKTLEKVISTNVTILLEGESGTGKDLIANYIHNHSIYSKGPFININCAAIPENLIESELFGYEKGAFTGADQQKIGKFELAETGTLFLDEIGELSLNTQAKLLRILQNKKFSRVGGIEEFQSKARIIAATNQPLLELCRKGKFREDLYYRLSSFPISIPALRNRQEDIEKIASYLLKKFSTEFNKPLKQFSSDGLAHLKAYAWPGNIREMQNIISRITLLEPDTVIKKEQLIPYLSQPTEKETMDFNFIADIPEKELLKIHANEIFKKCNYNKSDTAKKLGINYRTLIKRLEDST